MEPWVLVMFLVVGVLGGFIGGMLGVGGGILFVPCLHIGFQSMGVAPEISFQMSVATSLAIILVTSLSSALGHTVHGNLDPKAVLLMAMAAIPTSLAGAGIGSVLGGAKMERVFGFALLLVSIQFLRPITPKHAKTDHEITPTSLVMVGGVSGFVSSILGVGGGILTVPLLHLLLNLPMNLAVGNSSGLIIFSALFGSIGWAISGWREEDLPPYSIGYVNLAAWVLIAFGALLSAQAGAWVTSRLPANGLRRPFGVVILLIGIKMAFF